MQIVVVLLLCLVLSGCATHLTGYDGQRCGLYSADPDLEAVEQMGALASQLGKVALTGTPSIRAGTPSVEDMSVCAGAKTCVYWRDGEKGCLIYQGGE